MISFNKLMSDTYNAQISFFVSFFAKIKERSLIFVMAIVALGIPV
jgi:hypothetical protein